jgi:peptide deformylase
VVEKITPEVLQVAQDLVDSMRSHNCTGLAAPQIGSDLRIFCLDTGEDLDEEGYPIALPIKVFINPEITYASKNTSRMGEGCGSIPGFYEEFLRPKEINVRALDIDGNVFEENGLKFWRSRAIQHELDHLDGILILDRWPPNVLKRHEQELKLLEMRHSQTSVMRGDPFRGN